MKCKSSVFYSVNVNRRSGRIFSPTRVLRQGDLLNHFLFLIYSEGLSALMKLAMRGRLLKGAKASRSGPQISHLLFADDCILFGEATNKGVTLLKEILKEYESFSSQ